MIDAATIFASKILIVDDQQANVRVLEIMLERAGYLSISSTTNPAAVCDLHHQNHYDLILLDLQMPVMDGFDVMEGLKQTAPESDSSIFVITAQPSHKLRAMQAGARDFIGKPFDHSEVLIRIHYLLEVQLLRREAQDYSKRLEATVEQRTAALHRSEEMFRALAANIPDALWIRDTENKTIQYTNPAWKELSGISAAAGDSLENVVQAVHPDDLPWSSQERRKPSSPQANNEYRVVRPDHSVRWVHARSFSIANPSGNAPWIGEIIEDITQRREAEHQLQHLARHDALTGLPNRMLLYESLSDAVARAKAEGLAASVLLVDIDFFKNVNDTLGHVIGDALLCDFATVLDACVRPGDKVGRLGGDEFAVIVLTPPGSAGANEVADRIRNALQSPFLLEGQTLFVTASIGIASYPTDAADFEMLVRHADAAMYAAKASGRDTYRCYTPEMNALAKRKSELESALKLALRRDEFVLHYQPKMELATGRWSSVEALIRWNRPGHGLVAPLNFVPALEDLGLIVPVGVWVIGRACRQIREWQLAGQGNIGIAVNVSAKQVCEEQFVSQVVTLVRHYRIDPGLLEFEITEGTLMAHGESSTLVLAQLKDMGVTISIDDFGTGYSNLAYLKRFRVDCLKIDMGFIRDVTTSTDDAAITVAIINMAHSLRLKVVAEGVETQDQLEFLRGHGCDEIQGYLLSKPLPATEISAILERSIESGTETKTALRIFEEGKCDERRISHG